MVEAVKEVRQRVASLPLLTASGFLILQVETIEPMVGDYLIRLSYCGPGLTLLFREIEPFRSDALRSCIRERLAAAPLGHSMSVLGNGGRCITLRWATR